MSVESLKAHSVEAAWAQYDAVDAGPTGLNAFLSVDRKGSLAATTSMAAGPHTGHAHVAELAGVPVAIKDNLATLVLPTTCGSRMLEGYVSPYEATAVRKLRDAGAIVIGKTNMDEFAMGSSTENSAFGPTRNPVDRSRVPGGSSGGSAAAVAAGVVRLALGSETGGSVRQPAAFCGIVGVKPTYGRVSRFGLVAYASSLDHVGVFAQNVFDAALGVEIIAGHDPYDATCSSRPVPALRQAAVIADSTLPLAGLVVGRPVEYFTDALDPRIRAHCDTSLERLRSLGAEVTRRILLGTYVLSAGYYEAYYRRAQTVRALITQDFERVFAEGVHVLFTPTAPTPAFRIGELSDPYDMYLSDIYTVTANLAGIPAMSQPIGRVEGLPVGGQFMAARYDEATMFKAAAALEDAMAREGGA